MSSDKIKTIFFRFVFIILFKELLGKKPPAETKVILKLSELNIRTFAIFKDRKIIKLKIAYKIKIFDKRLLMLFSLFILPSPEYVKSFILYLNCLLEKISIKKIKKYNPPIH